MEGMYFRLSNLVYMTEGHTCSLYDMKDNKIVLLDQEASRLLRHCEANRPLEEYSDYEEMAEPIAGLLNQLKSWEMGHYSPVKEHIEKFRFNLPGTMKGFNTPLPYYVRVYLELGGSCNRACPECDEPQESRNWMGCRSCVGSRRETAVPGRGRDSAGVESIGLEPIGLNPVGLERAGSEDTRVDYIGLIDALRELEVRELVVRGGSPLLEAESLRAILRHARATYPALAVTVITNGTEASFEDICSLYGEHPAFQLNVVLFGLDTPERQAGESSPDFRAFVAAQCGLLDQLHAAGLRYSVTLQLTGDTREQGAVWAGLIPERWGVQPMVSEAVAKGEGRPLAHLQGNSKPLARYKYGQEFFVRQQYNTCLYGVFAIDARGDVTPCPEIRETIGNITEEGLTAVLGKERLYDFWEMTKNKLNHCRQCGMKYYCSDCSAFEVAAERERDALQSYCSIASSADPAAAVLETDFKADPYLVRLELKP